MKKQPEIQENIKILELEKTISELNNSWKRALADYQNLERRSKEEKEQFAKYAKGSLIQKLLPSLDSLVKAGIQLNNEGLTLSLKTIMMVLENEGLKEIDALGKDFNPEMMEAIELVSGEANKVIEVTQKGYLLYDRVLRPAIVKVGKGKEKISNK